jgi:hypothetical protein
MDTSTDLGPGGHRRRGHPHAGPTQIGCAKAADAKYERGMSKYPVGQYRDRVGVGLNVEMVYLKVAKKS